MSWIDFLSWGQDFANTTPLGAYGSAIQGEGTTSYQSAEAALNGPAQSNYKYHFGDFLSGQYNAARQQAAQNNADYAEWVRNQYSAAQQRAWEEYMDSTKTQRAMADIKAAGLNPWLALQSAGLGGSVPSGAAASSSAGQAAAGQSGSQALMGLGTAAAGIAMLVKTIAKIVK